MTRADIQAEIEALRASIAKLEALEKEIIRAEKYAIAHHGHKNEIRPGYALDWCELTESGRATNIAAMAAVLEAVDAEHNERTDKAPVYEWDGDVEALAESLQRTFFHKDTYVSFLAVARRAVELLGPPKKDTRTLDEMAEAARDAFVGLHDASWHGLDEYARDSWRRVARAVLGEP